MQQKLGVIGKKLGHSFSPDIFREFGYPQYELIELPEDKVIDYIMNTSFKGVNVTIPYKEKVLRCCDRISDEAREIGCVNALVKEADGTISGYNTDVYGIMGALQYAGISLAGKKVLVLGGGGTSLTARHAAKKMGAGEVLFVSRKGPLYYDQLPEHRDVQIIINTTSVGMFPDNEGKIISLTDFPCCEGLFDVVYNPLQTRLILEAKELGIKCIGGLYMLVEQARIAAGLFTGEEVTKQQGHQVYELLKENIIRKENILLIGFMGTGKSTVADFLGHKYDKKVIEMDQLIAEREKMSISDIFAVHGEEYFRSLETGLLLEVQSKRDLIVSCGGGAAMREENVREMKKNGKVVLLTASPEVIFERIKDSDERPLLNGNKNIDYIRELIEQRRPKYEAAADIIIHTDHKSTAQICQELTEKLYQKIEE